MSTNVGELKCSLTLSQFEFAAGLRASETAALEFANVVDRESKRADASMGRLAKTKGPNFANMAQQIGYGIQDASSQWERGAGAMIGATTNNIQAIAASLGPVSAATLGIGAAVGGIVVPAVIEWLLNSRQLAIEAKEYSDQLSRAIAMRKSIAELEVRGGADKERKDLEDKVAIYDNLKKSVSETLEAERKGIADLENLKKSAPKKKTNIGDDVLNGITFGMWGAGPVDQDPALTAMKDKLKTTQEAFNKIAKESMDAHNKLNAIGPGSLAGVKEDEIKKDSEFEKHFDESAKRQKDMWAAEADIKKRGLTEFGNATQNAQAKIEAERLHLVKLGISAESAARFEAQSKVALKIAEITDQEKKISEMGAAAGMSAGVVRSSSAGVTAINRAMAGTGSEQSIAKDHLKVARDSLIELKKAARVTMVSLSG